MEALYMYDENDYIMKQIKSMVRGLGKFMGLEQIKDLLQLNDDQQGSITDLELESIITNSKLEIIISNKGISIDQLTEELDIEENQLRKIISHEVPATQDELTILNEYINDNQAYL